MRTFYIFNINKNFYYLMKKNPYHLYRTIEDIKDFDKNDANVAYAVFNQMTLPFNKDSINSLIFNECKNNDFYTKIKNTHQIKNKYIPEESKLIVNNTYLLLESNILKPSFLTNLKGYEHLFVCDFKNKDYFWLNELVRL